MNFTFSFRKANKQGFTLVEILVVMAIIGILATVGGSSFLTSRLRGRDAERKGSLAQVQRALELYYNDHNQYPDDTELEWGEEFRDTANPNGEVYMAKLPQDPRDPEKVYFYEVSSDNQKFRLYARLENTRDLITDLDADDVPGDSYDGTVGIGDGQLKPCGDLPCNYGISSSSTNLEETFQ